MDTNKQIKIGNSYGTIPVGSPADPTRTVAQTDAYFQNLADKNPESADILMDRYGYTNSPNVITPDALKNQPKIHISGTNITQPIDTSLVANATQNATNFDTQAEFQRQLDLQKQTTPDQTPLNDILASLTNAEKGLTGRGAEQLTAETQAGIPEAQKARATLQGQIKSQLAEYNALKTQRDQLIADLEVGTRGTGNADIRASMLFGQQGAVERQYSTRLNSKASEIGLLQAQDEALAGQIETAQNTVNRAIDLKYQDKEAEYQIKKLQYDRIKDNLSAEEKKRGEAMQNALKKEENALAEKKQNEKTIEKMLLDATPNAPANVIAKAKEIANKGGKAIDVATALGQYGGDYLGDKLKRLQITKAGEEINKLRAEIKATTSPISTTNIPNTSTGFVQKLLLTAKNDKNLDTSERQQLSKMGMVISQLGALQSNLNKNNKTGVIKGRVNKLLGDLNLDKDITTINAQIQALIPNVARGIYGEVGVLTDADIANYKKTVANLTNSKDQNDAVLALTLKNALKSYENTLNTASNSGINVSGWAEDYLKINNQVKTIEDRIGVSKQAVNDLIIKDKNLAPVVKELYQNGLTDGEILDALNAR